MAIINYSFAENILYILIPLCSKNETLRKGLTSSRSILGSMNILMVKNTQKISPFKNLIFSSHLYISNGNRKGVTYYTETLPYILLLLKPFIGQEDPAEQKQ